MLQIKAHFDGKNIVPDEPVNLATGAQFVVEIKFDRTPLPPYSALEFIAKNQIDDASLPEDLSVNLDHYLYGAPKQEP